jgi:hypothetical protein
MLQRIDKIKQFNAVNEKTGYKAIAICVHREATLYELALIPVYLTLYLSIVDMQNSNKINSLLKSWPYGTIAVSSWLKNQGVSAQLAAVYKKSGWIEPVAHGAFVHAGDKVSWLGGLYALQEEMGLSVHAGGRTALQLHGNAHFLSMSAEHPVFLFGLERSLPNWFMKYSWGTPVRNVYTHCFPYKERTGLTERKMEAYSIWLSTPNWQCSKFFIL